MSVSATTVSPLRADRVYVPIKLGQAFRFLEESPLMPVKEPAVKGRVTVTLPPLDDAAASPGVNSASPPSPLFQTCQRSRRSPG